MADEKIDLDELERLEREATAGPWELWTSNSHERITGPDQKDGGVLCAYRAPSDGMPVVGARRADMNAIVAARNALPELLRRARKLEAVEGFLREHGGDG